MLLAAIFNTEHFIEKLRCSEYEAFGFMDPERRDRIPQAMAEPGVETKSLARAQPAPFGTTIHQHPGQPVPRSVSEVNGPGDHIPATCTLAHLQGSPSAVCPGCRLCHVYRPGCVHQI